MSQTTVGQRVWQGVALIALCGAAACGEARPRDAAPAIVEPTTHPITPVARLHGTVDVTAGTLTFEAIPAASGPSLSASGPDAAIYGTQGTTVRIYNSPVVIGAPASGKKTYSANVGIRNLLPYRVGDEQAGLLPPDTMGIYVFVNSAPTVTGTSSACACTVTVKNQHGSLPFNAANQPYWFWPEILGPANSTQDTTLARKAWVFEADTAVTRFSFDVLVSAPWANPNETRWKVDYEADSLPDAQSEPKWRIRKSGTGPYSTSAGLLTVNPGNSGAETSFYRRDSVGVTASAYVEASVQYTGQSSRQSTARLVIDDNARFLALGVSGDTVGFINPSNAYIGAAVAMNTTSAFHRYQLRKYAADSVVYYVDGTRGGALNYSSFAVTSYPLVAPLIQFGMAGPDNSICAWDYVVYEIGTAAP